MTSLVTLEAHLVQELGSAFLVRSNRLSVNACLPSGHVSAGFPSLVLSSPLLSLGVLSSSKLPFDF